MLTSFNRNCLKSMKVQAVLLCQFLTNGNAIKKNTSTSFPVSSNRKRSSYCKKTVSENQTPENNMGFILVYKEEVNMDAGGQDHLRLFFDCYFVLIGRYMVGLNINIKPNYQRQTEKSLKNGKKNDLPG